MPSLPHDDHAADSASRKAAQRGIRNRALTIGMSVVPFGLSFGAVSVETHLSLLQVCLLSLVLFSGASQFALVSVISGGGSYLSAVGTALLLGARNGLYGVRINALFHPRGWRRLAMAETTIDESTAMAVSEATSGYALRAFWTTALSVYVLWNISTVVGALVGQRARITGDGRPRCRGTGGVHRAARTASVEHLDAIRGARVGCDRACDRLIRAGGGADPDRRLERGRAATRDRPMRLWLAVIIASLGCAALKLSGYVVPARFVESRVARRLLEALPVTLLSALIAVSTFATGSHLMLDSRAAGLAVALVLVAIRAPFLVVVVAACAAAAGVHALHP